MLKKFIEWMCPPLSERWARLYAADCTRIEFEENVRRSGAIPIYHVTNKDSAKSIHKNSKIYGVDVVSAAHFHYRPDGAARQANCNGILLGFSWAGDFRRLNLDMDPSTHGDRRPNILFDVPIGKYNDETWELRLYPGSIGLKLQYFELDTKGFTINNPVELEVIQG